MAWLTGYDGWSFYVHQACWCRRRRAGLVRPRPGRQRRQAHVLAAHDNIVGYPDHYVQSTERHPMDFLSEVIPDRGWGKRTIGVEMDNYWFSAAAYRVVAAHLPNARFATPPRWSTGSAR